MTPTKGRYRVAVPKGWGALGYVDRPNKNAAGMTKTAARSGHNLEGDTLRLAVFGSLDRVGSRFRMQVVPVVTTVYRLRKNKKVLK